MYELSVENVCCDVFCCFVVVIILNVYSLVYDNYVDLKIMDEDREGGEVRVGL